ncbi:unnamed protein product [Urochloa humidicola]
MAAAATSIFSSRPPPLLQPTANPTSVSFPRRPLAPAATLTLSAHSQPPVRGSALVPAANPKYHNAKADAGEEDVDGEELLRRFTWQVSRAGVMVEIRRRRRHEDARDKRKRKARSVARKFRRRRFKGPYPFDGEQGPKDQSTDDEENDNWELPGGELPSYR